MTQLPNYQPPAPARGLVIGVVISSILGLGGLAWIMLGTDTNSPVASEDQAQLAAGTAFPALEVDTSRLEQARRDHYEEPNLGLVEDDTAELRTTFRQINLSQFPNAPRPDGLAPVQLAAKVEFLAADVAGFAGVRGFLSAGQPHFDRCNDGLQILLAAVRDGDLTMDQAQEDPPAEEFRDYREHCGNLLPQLTQRNLVDDQGDFAHPEAAIIIDLLQRYRWADMVRNIYPLHELISPYELELFFRWRIEDAQAFAPRQRRQFLARAQNRYLPESYDFDLAWARLDVANLDLEGALPRFEELVAEHPTNTLYQAIYDDIAAEVGQLDP